MPPLVLANPCETLPGLHTTPEQISRSVGFWVPLFLIRMHTGIRFPPSLLILFSPLAITGSKNDDLGSGSKLEGGGLNVRGGPASLLQTAEYVPGKLLLKVVQPSPPR